MSNPTPEQKLAALGLTLPAVPAPLANYVPCRWAGNLLFSPARDRRSPMERLKSDDWARTLRSTMATGRLASPACNCWRSQNRRLANSPHRGGGQTARHGQRRARLRRSPQSHQRLLRSLRRNAWRCGPPRPLGRRDGLATQRHHGRDRSHFADPIVRHGANQGCIIATAISR
jgi:hypothetical protein